MYAVVLAAGGSTRFGGIKQLVELSGRSLLARSVETAAGVFGERVVVVLGLKAVKMRRELASLNARIAVNERWQEGLATSLQAGLEALPDDCQAALIMFCDQPLIGARHLHDLEQAWNRNPQRIITSAYAGTRGVPVVFPRRFFPDIARLSGDCGARSLLDRYREDISEVEIPEAEFDIDTQEDLIAILGGDIQYGDHEPR